MQQIILYATTLLWIMTFDMHAHYKAVVKDPVIEMNNNFPPPPVNSPIGSGTVSNCQRAHQALYNEIFNVVEERDNFVKINSEKVKYNRSLDENSNTFWAYKHNIQAIDALDAQTLATIPDPGYAQTPTIVLTYPWKHFSVGTRFKHLPIHDIKNTFAVIHADFDTNRIQYDYIPRTHAIKEINRTDKKIRKLFVKTIDKLMDRIQQDNPDYIIPYVWGGNSFVTPYIDSESYEEHGVWQRIGQNNPYTGYDCSGLVMRMAQIAGLNFPWKTTSVIQQSLKQLTPDDTLQNGDLIWIQGHVMIISNIAKNEVIEARGYNSGYGKVHKTTLDQAFEDITTYDTLLEHYYAQKPLRFKNKQGEFHLQANFKLLKLM